MLNDKAGELGRLIGQSAEYQALKRANEALKDETALVAALRRMDALRDEAQQMLQRGEQPTEAMEQELELLLGTVQANASYQRMLAANENFEKLMGQVNQWIGEGIQRGATSSIITLG
jgi:cell fate (sporulation/competence/biofilm development) regulator YlbF (YheA/YmcA/DUF963 family)